MTTTAEQRGSITCSLIIKRVEMSNHATSFSTMAFHSSSLPHPKLTIFFLLCSLAVTMSAVADSRTHFHFYMHDILSKPNATALKVVPSGANATIVFGDITVIDDPLTEGPNITSELVGRAQGMYVSVSQSQLTFMLTLNFLFVEGKYNGSTLAVQGLDEILLPVREVAIVGGTGVFRRAQGYVLIKTYTLNITTGDAVLEVDVYVDA